MATLAVISVLTGDILHKRHRARRRWIAAAGLLVSAIAAGAVAYRHVLPELAARHVERVLAAHGFAGARVQAAAVGAGGIRLTGVTLGDGLALGTVELDAGLSALWQPRIHRITVRGARLSPAILDRLAPTAGGAADPPFDVVRIVDGTVTLGGAQVAVSGTVAPGARCAVDLVASVERVALGPVELRGARATVRDDGTAVHACVTGRVQDAAVEACTALPRSLAALRALRSLDASWTAGGAGWQLRGHGTLAWASGLELRDGHVDLVAPSLAAGGFALHGAAIAADLAGSLARLELDVRGVARADRLERRAASAFTAARSVRVPFAARVAVVDGAVRATPGRPVIAAAEHASIRVADTAIELARPTLAVLDAGRMVALDAALGPPGALRWSAGGVRIGGAQLRDASGVLVGRRTLQWRAAEARWGAARVRDPAGTVELGASPRHTAHWTAVTGPGPIELGPGELRAHRSGDRWILDYGRASALGGELVTEPVAAPADRPLELAIHARGLALHRVLAAFARGRADGSGVLDGELAIELAVDGPWLRRAALRARPRGTLQLSDPAWRAQASASAVRFALHQRVAATLADFEYLQLAAVLAPAGSDPELRITAQGRGRRIAQDLDLVINVRGVRDAARRLPFAQSLRSKP